MVAISRASLHRWKFTRGDSALMTLAVCTLCITAQAVLRWRFVVTSAALVSGLWFILTFSLSSICIRT